MALTAQPKTGAKSAADAHPAEVGIDLDTPPLDTARSFEDWQLDHNVRTMQARSGPWHERPTRHADSAGSRRPQWRLDAAHLPVAPPHRPKRRATSRRSGSRSPTLTNSALLLGLLAGVGGVGVLAWSVAEARADLWNIGLSAVVAGTVVFLLGLVMQLERIWNSSRFAAHKLRQIDSHLQDLERTTASLAATNSSASQGFYSHLADQAHPHLLLSDLKGQLDMLAMNLSRR